MTAGAEHTPALRTFLLADIRGYTAYTAEHGDAAAARLSELFLSLCREVVVARGGTVFGSAGDQALAAFPSARDALQAAVALQERLAEEQATVPDLPLHAGIGLDAGEAIEVAGDYRGGAVNLAARLCSIAAGGEIFASYGVIHVARKTEGVAFVDRGEVTLKGFPGTVRVLQIARDGQLPAALPPLQPILIAQPNNLPDEPTPFIGREEEIGQIVALLGGPYIRLLTLTGPGGTGKTRLALQVGGVLLHNFRDGVFFCDLSPLADPTLVPQAIAGALGVQEAPGQAVLATLTAHLQDKHLLLVLDNVEHLLDACSVVASLLDTCRTLTLLATSRIPLHLSREHEYPVSPLAVPDPAHLPTTLSELTQYEAVALFIERARAIKPDFQVTNESAPAVAELCYRLDGLPLAIELAAARIKLFPPRALLTRLSSRFSLLTGGAKDRPSRQQTLRGAIDWSYSLLSGEEQTLFGRLSVFAGGCSFDAAEAVCAAAGDLDVLGGLASLVDKSLLRQEGEDEPRFTLLETIREYARDTLDERGQGPLTRGAHARYFLTLAEDVQPQLTGPRQGECLSHLARELDNLRAALGWFFAGGQVEEALRLTTALFYFWFIRGYLTEGRRWLEEGLDRADGVAPSVRGWALFCAGTLAGEQGDLDHADRVLHEALTVFQTLGDQLGRARVLNSLGVLVGRRGQYEEATTLYEESLLHWREVGDRLGAARALGNLGLLAIRLENWTMAIHRFQESLVIFRELGDIQNVAVTLMNLSIPALNQKRFDEAEAWAKESLALFRGLDAKQRIAQCLTTMCSLFEEQGQFERAREALREGVLMAQEIGTTHEILYLIDSAARLAWAEGRVELAVCLGGAGAALRASFAMPRTTDDQTESEQRLAAATSQVGKENVDEAWGRGQRMSLDDAVACVLGESERMSQ